MSILGATPQVDFAGNYPVHYLMSSGVGLEFLSTMPQWTKPWPRNVFDQNPLHVLNPMGLGENLISFLELLKYSEDPPTLPHQRDIYCRTPLQTLLLWPLERHLYPKILDIFPLAEQQLHSFDHTGCSIPSQMNKASLKIKETSHLEFAKIQAGITEVKLYLSANGRSQNRIPQYGFHDIARGALGLTYPGYFLCKICDEINAHTSSYWDQTCCAVLNGRDPYEPDDIGMTPAQAIIALPRCSMDDEGTPIPETASETLKLFLGLIPPSDPNLHEALHVLDPEGNSLVFNIAIRGMDELLTYILDLEHPSRRCAMVNFCGRGPYERHLSVLDAVEMKIQGTLAQIRATPYLKCEQELEEHHQRLLNCKVLLCKAGAKSRPNLTTRWRIQFDEPADSRNTSPRSSLCDDWV